MENLARNPKEDPPVDADKSNEKEMLPLDKPLFRYHE